LCGGKKGHRPGPKARGIKPTGSSDVCVANGCCRRLREKKALLRARKTSKGEGEREKRAI
jgi:hypothetical protein